MNHILNLDYTRNETLEKLFESISVGNTILFLGAGASVSKEKSFLSKDIIEFYEDKKQISWGIPDITEFVDALILTNGYSREEFDNYVDECLRKYKVTDSHKILASLSWRLIITTNYDLLVEKAFEEIVGTSNENLKLKVVNTVNDFRGIQAADEVKYVKLNGCISNKKQYKLIFSTEDFEKAKKYYKTILDELRNPSDKVNFLSIGYSYSDPFAAKLIERIDSYKFRDRRVFYTVDPYINDAMLPVYAEKKICVIKATMSEFLNKFKEWEESNASSFKAYRNLAFHTPANSNIILSTHVNKRLDGNIVQLDDFYKARNISDAQFYKGEEPDYAIINKNYDVVHKKKIDDTIKKINEKIGETSSRLIPIFFLVGTFGSGKSTFAYRLINSFIHSDELSKTVAFEIIDPYSLQVPDLKELFSKTNASRIFIYVNAIEVNTTFKSLMELRNRLTIDGSSEYEIIFITSIRENILEINRVNKDFKNAYAINIDSKFSLEETEELVEKLKRAGLREYRDIGEKQELVNRIMHDYDGDSYLILWQTVSGNKHVEDLYEAYNELGNIAKRAFLYTSFLYQFKILMPASLLRNIVSKDWDEFRKDVIEVQGKGILIQEETTSVGTNPDLYFRTKHPLISESLIDIIVPNEDAQYKHYQDIVTHLISGSKNSQLLVNLLKAIWQYKKLPAAKLNRLYDLADAQLSEDPYFLLHYAMNLQNRGTEKALNEAIAKIIYAEALSEKRNHRLIHRRGVLNFELAKIYFKIEKVELNKTFRYLNEARELLEIKRISDPCSSYSYVDRIYLEMWYLENVNLIDEEILQTKISIEELIDAATHTVFENSHRIYEIKNKYINKYHFNQNEEDYMNHLQEYYNELGTRPYALVLMFNYYMVKGNHLKCEEYLEQLEYYSDYKDVLKLLLKFYGRNLNIANYRMKFFDLVRRNPELEESDNLRFNYFNFIAESYNKNFNYGEKFLGNIHDKFNYFNPDFHQEWKETDSNEVVVFSASIKFNNKGRKVAYISILNKYFLLDNNKQNIDIKKEYHIKLHFFLYGTRAEIISEVKIQ